MIWNLNAGDEIILELEWGDRVPAKIISILRNRYMLVKSMATNVPFKIKTGAQITVTVFGPTKYKVQSRIVHLIPDSLLIFVDLGHCRFLQFPERRRHKRYQILTDGLCMEFGNYHDWRCHIINICKSGCLALGGFPFLVDRKLIVSFRNPWTREIIRAEAKEVRSESVSRGVQSGLDFTGIMPADGRRLDDLIILLDNPGNFYQILENTGLLRANNT